MHASVPFFARRFVPTTARQIALEADRKAAHAEALAAETLRVVQSAAGVAPLRDAAYADPVVARLQARRQRIADSGLTLVRGGAA